MNHFKVIWILYATSPISVILKIIRNKYASCMNMASFARKVFVVTPFLPMRHINIRCSAGGTRGAGVQSPFRFWLGKRQNLQLQERHWITICPPPLCNVWCTLNRTTHKLSLWLHYRLFGKFLFHIPNLSCQKL